MKFNKIQSLLLLASVLWLPAKCAASGESDTFAADRTLVLAPMQNFVVNGGQGVITNPAVDITALMGTAIINVHSITNTGTTGGTLTLAIRGSADQTNWVTLANVAVVTNTTSVISTNYNPNIVGAITNGFLTATTSFLLPYTPTIPSAPTAGFSTSYPVYQPLTNSATGIVINGTGGVQIGFRVVDAPHYLQAVWTAGGTVTNFSAGAEIVSPTRFSF